MNEPLRPGNKVWRIGDRSGSAGMTARQRKVLHAVLATEPLAYGNSILAQANSDIRSNWLTRRWPILDELRGLSIGSLYFELFRCEREGLLRSEWGTDRPPERGFRRRRYYFLTEQGRAALVGADAA